MRGSSSRKRSEAHGVVPGDRRLPPGVRLAPLLATSLGRTPAHEPLRADQWRGDPDVARWGAGARGVSPYLCAPGRERSQSRGTPVGPFLVLAGTRPGAAPGAPGEGPSLRENRRAHAIDPRPSECRD